MKKENVSGKIILSFTIILILAAVVIPYQFLMGLTFFGFIILLIFDRRAYKELGNPKFWLFIFTIVVVIPISLGEKDSTLFIIKYSSENLMLGIQMTLRSLCIYMGIILITRNISISRISNFLKSSGSSEFLYVLPIGLNTIPIVRRNFFQIVTVFKLRGGFRKDRLKNLYKFLLALLINTIKMSEEIAQIIELSQPNQKSEL